MLGSVHSVFHQTVVCFLDASRTGSDSHLGLLKVQYLRVRLLQQTGVPQDCEGTSTRSTATRRFEAAYRCEAGFTL